MTLYTMFIYGFIGAFAADFQNFINTLPPQAVSMPKQYTRVSYWVIPIIHATLGGCLAVAWGQSNPTAMPLTLMAVGGAAQLIIRRFGDVAGRMKEL